MQTQACTTQNDRSPRQWEPDERVTLSQAARIAPGGVSPNCIWRWCRRGVLARTGERVRLEHVRIGGKLYTTPRWIDEFGRRLADADAEYFEIADEESPAPSAGPPPRRRARRLSASRQSDEADEARRERVRAELEAEGL